MKPGNEGPSKVCYPASSMQLKTAERDDKIEQWEKFKVVTKSKRPKPKVKHKIRFTLSLN